MNTDREEEQVVSRARKLFAGPYAWPLGFGTWAFSEAEWGTLDTPRAKSLLSRAWEAGFRHFDTAEAYGNGRSEQLIGQALREKIRHRRETIRIATKSVVREPGPLGKHLERSLRRLGTDFVDLYYIHWPREGVSLIKAVEELVLRQSRGLIRAVGLCNVTGEEYREIARRFPVAAVQAGYNLIWRGPEENLWPFVESLRVAYSPLGQGLLARPFQHTPTWDPRDHRRTTPLFHAPAWDEVFRFNLAFMNLCRQAELEPAAVALRWLLGSSDDTSAGKSAGRVDAAVVGGRTVAQLDGLVSGLEKIGTGDGETRYQAVVPALEEHYRSLRESLPTLPNVFGYVPRARRSAKP